MKTPSAAPATAAEDAATAAGTPDSTVLPRTDSVPPASLTDDAIVISSSPILDSETLGEVMAVVGLFNSTNAIAEGYQIEPDILPPLD